MSSKTTVDEAGVELNENGRPTGRILEQTAIPGTEKPEKRKRRTILERAVVGDLVIAYRPTPRKEQQVLIAIEQVGDENDGPMIRDRWIDQGVITDGSIEVVVFECRPGGYYRKRRAGR